MGRLLRAQFRARGTTQGGRCEACCWYAETSSVSKSACHRQTSRWLYCGCRTGQCCWRQCMWKEATLQRWTERWIYSPRRYAQRSAAVARALMSLSPATFSRHDQLWGGDEVLPQRQGEADHIIEFMNKWSLESLLFAGPRPGRVEDTLPRSTSCWRGVAGVGVERPQVQDLRHGAWVGPLSNGDVFQRWNPRSRYPTSIVVQKCSLEDDPGAYRSRATGSTSMW